MISLGRVNWFIPENNAIKQPSRMELTINVQVFELRIKGIMLFISKGFVFLRRGSNEEYQNNI